MGTHNENMPLRSLEYYVHLLYRIIPEKLTDVSLCLYCIIDIKNNT